jgi:ferredoxin-NADP reductase
MSSSPLEKNFVSLTTKIIQSEFKKALFALKEQDEIKIFGPMGQFILEEHDTRKKIFLAGGIGVTPFHSIITYATAANLNLPITLLASFSIPEEMIFFNELTKIANSHANIQDIYTITKPQESKTSWIGETGRVSENMIKKYAKDIMQSVFYIVGPSPMVEGTKKLLEDMKITNENIKIEQFTGY